MHNKLILNLIAANTADRRLAQRLQQGASSTRAPLPPSIAFTRLPPTFPRPPASKQVPGQVAAVVNQTSRLNAAVRYEKQRSLRSF